MSDELERIKQEKIRQYLQGSADSQEQEMADKAEAMKHAVLLKFLSKEARERLSRVRITHPDLAAQVELAVMQAAQLGRLNRVIDDEELKSLLAQLTSGKKEIRIIRK